MNKDLEVIKQLVADNLLAQEKFDAIIKQKASTGKGLVELLVEAKEVDVHVLMDRYAKELAMPLVNLRYYPINPERVKVLPENLARRFLAIPIALVKDEYIVAMCNPENIMASDQISNRLRKKIRPVLVEKDLLFAIDNLFRRSEEIMSLVGEVGESFEKDSLSIESDDEAEVLDEGASEDAPIVNLLMSIFNDAVQIGSSDIHIEPGKDYFKIRQRVDGVLQEQIVKDKNVLPALISRIKLMGKMNISEKRLPQDGSFIVKTKGKKLDVRVSSMPVKYGESVVMRLLSRESNINNLRLLGMPEQSLSCILRNVKKPNGMILVTGPTGSGKSTLLYAIFNEIDTKENKVITIEDPVEYTIKGANQVQVNSKIGLDFARVLRASLRQDPDVIMVGEIRDSETAEIALQSSITGHLVFSTLHTNSAAGSVERLMDIGIEPFLIASALRMVVGQRLLRKICEACTDKCKPSKEELAWLASEYPDVEITADFKKGKGCSVCHNTGFVGRHGVFEIVEIDEGMTQAIRLNEIDKFDKMARSSPYYVPLKKGALDLALRGITSLREVIKLVGGME